MQINFLQICDFPYSNTVDMFSVYSQSKLLHRELLNFNTLDDNEKYKDCVILSMCCRHHFAVGAFECHI